MLYKVQSTTGGKHAVFSKKRSCVLHSSRALLARPSAVGVGVSAFVYLVRRYRIIDLKMDMYGNMCNMYAHVRSTEHREQGRHVQPQQL
jgi:hypothetical protein